jgi:hypothetical protein
MKFTYLGVKSLRMRRGKELGGYERAARERYEFKDVGVEMESIMPRNLQEWVSTDSRGRSIYAIIIVNE